MQQQTSPSLALTVRMTNSEFKEFLAYLDWHYRNTRVTTFIDWILN